MSEEQLKANISHVREQITAAAKIRADKTGVLPEVTLVAATKTVDADTINAAVKLGITDIGENRAQEFNEKHGLVQGADWHFIGTLQSNKVKYLVGKVKLIQSVSSVALVREIARVCEVRGVKQDILVEVNVGGEASKTGAEIYDVESIVSAVAKCDAVRLRGFMAVLPVEAESVLYEKAYEIYARYAGGETDVFSMGMSGDFYKAIQFGSNMVRVGSSIFGTRNYR